MIKKWREFNEASGTEELISLGPASNRTQQQITLDRGDTEMVYTELTDKVYSFDEYEQLYNDFLKVGGRPLFGFNRTNLDEVILTLNNQ